MGNYSNHYSGFGGDRYMSTEEQGVVQPAGSGDPMRNNVRFPLRLKVRVQTDSRMYEAETEDVSASGVLFRMREAPDVNTRLSWTMTLPANHTGAPSDTVVHCVGRVVWNASSGEWKQVGVVIDSYRIGDGA